MEFKVKHETKWIHYGIGVPFHIVNLQNILRKLLVIPVEASVAGMNYNAEIILNNVSASSFNPARSERFVDCNKLLNGITVCGSYAVFRFKDFLIISMLQ